MSSETEDSEYKSQEWERFRAYVLANKKEERCNG